MALRRICDGRPDAACAAQVKRGVSSREPTTNGRGRPGAALVLSHHRPAIGVTYATLQGFLSKDKGAPEVAETHGRSAENKPIVVAEKPSCLK